MPKAKTKSSEAWREHCTSARYLLGAGASLAATGIRYALEPIVGPHAPYLPFVVAVIVTARFGGRGPSFVATALCALSSWYFFIEPRNSFGIEGPAAAANLVLFVAVGITISLLIGQLRVAAITNTRRESVLARQTQLIDLSHDAIITVDANRVIRSWNTGAAEMYGWTGPEASGKVIEDLLHTRNHLSMAEIREMLLRDGRWEGQLIHTGRDGKEVIVESRQVLTRGRDGSAVGFLEINRDITDRKKTEENLRASEARFRALVTASSDVVYRMSPDWREMRQLRGQNFIADTEAPNDRWLDEYIHPDDQAQVMAVINEAIRTKSIFELEHRVRTVDGSLGWTFSRAVPLLNEKGEIIEWFGAASDVTARKRAEEALRESEQRVRRKLESILSPDVDIGDIDLGDIIDTEAIQSLLNDFSELAHMPAGILDRKGDFLVKAGWQEICTRFHRVHPDTLRNCRESDTEMAECVEPGDYKLYKCPNNLSVVATPFMVAGRHLGNIFTSQFLLDDELVNIDTFSSQADRYGFDQRDYLAALGRVPKINRHTAETTISFLRKFGEIIGKLSYANIKLAKSLAALQRAQDEVRHVSEQRGLALEAAKLGSWDYRFETKEVFRDERCRKIWGVPAGGRVSYDDAIARIHADDRAATDEAMERAMAGVNDGAFHVEFRVLWPDGSVHWVGSHGRVQFEGEGNQRKPTRFVGVNADITERKDAENEILRLNATLERRVEERTAELLEANRELESFSYSVSHDLRAPLRSVEGFARILVRDYTGKALDATALDYMRRMSAATYRMGQLIDDLLSLARLSRQEMTRQPVNLSRIADGILAEYHSQQPGRKVSTRVEPGLVADADPQLARIALENLLGNAWKYTGKTETASITFGVTRDDKRAAYFVCDNGAGFDMAHADQLFAPFQRLHRSEEFEGNGIGLATVQRVVRRHGGRVWAEAKPGQGAVFYFTLGEV